MFLRSLFVFFLSMGCLCQAVYAAEGPEAGDTAQIIEKATVPLGSPRPMGQSRTARDLFGSETGYIHPFFSLGEYFTDNLFNTKDDKESDFVTTISPGIWLVAPGSREQQMSVVTAPSSPGGHELSRLPGKDDQRYRAYALYRADIEKMKNNSGEDVTSHVAEGLLRYNFRGGLSVEAADKYGRGYESYSTSLSSILDKYESNMFKARVGYEVSEKLKFNLGYTLFDLDYNAAFNDFRDRQDGVYSGSVDFAMSSKTTFFLKYKFIDIDYDEETSNSSEESQYLAGIRWEVTGKSFGQLSAGVAQRDFDRSELGGIDDLIVECQLGHRISSKSAVSFSATRGLKESTAEGSRGIMAHAIKAAYNHKLTKKVLAQFNLSFVQDSYRGELDASASKRRDRNYGAGAGLTYELKQWLNLGAGYSYNKRTSNLSGAGYAANALYVNVTAAF